MTRRKRNTPSRTPIGFLALLLFVWGLIAITTRELPVRGHRIAATGPAAASAGSVLIALAIGLVIVAVMLPPEK